MVISQRDESSDVNVENIRVFVRVRPKTIRESHEDEKATIRYSGDRMIMIEKENKHTKSFEFNKVFTQLSSQMDLYCTVGVPIVKKVLEGYNGTIFAYGQSGTGKTYTMIGHPIKAEFKGIVPNIFSHIFTQISLANNEISYVVSVTYLEIYNEEVRDLLSNQYNKKLVIRERPDIGVYIKDLSGFIVDSMECVTELLIRGNKNRVTGVTKLNDVSSRSHAVFSITVESRDKKNDKIVFGKLNLVDLAGSERVNRTHATGDRLREAGKINLSLSVLGNVISALVDSKSSHIPYRNSKLTRLLQDSLGGTSMTAMIALISPLEGDYEETICTLMYAERVKHIKNYVTANVEKESVLEKFEEKIASLEKQLQDLQIVEENNSNNKKKKEVARKSSRNSLEEFERIRSEKQSLLEKISTIQKKILVGGENLLEKAQYQINMLEQSSKELKHLDNSHQQLEELLYNKGRERNKVKQNYSSLQEEDRDISAKIIECQSLLGKARRICLNKEEEYQTEISSLLYDNKCLARKMSLANFVVRNSIPDSQLTKITSNMVWDSNTQEWILKGVAYSGNNLKRRKQKVNQPVSWKTHPVYYDYPSKQSGGSA